MTTYRVKCRIKPEARDRITNLAEFDAGGGQHRLGEDHFAHREPPAALDVERRSGHRTKVDRGGPTKVAST